MKEYAVLMEAKKTIYDEIQPGEQFDEVFEAETSIQAQILAGKHYGLDTVKVLEVVIVEDVELDVDEVIDTFAQFDKWSENGESD